jgi:hypothetical protein
LLTINRVYAFAYRLRDELNGSFDLFVSIINGLPSIWAVGWVLRVPYWTFRETKSCNDQISVVLRGAAKVATVNQLATFEIWIRYAADAKLDSFLFPERQEEFVRCFKSSTGVSSADYKKENLHCYNPAGRKLDKAIRIQPN